MHMKELLENLDKRCVRACGDRDFDQRCGLVDRAAAFEDAFLDCRDVALGFLLATVDREPARAFRNPHAHEQDNEAKHRADEERQPPADVDREIDRVEQHHRGKRADGRADPETAVDRKVCVAAITCRDQFLDRRIDRRIFAADAGAGQQAKEAEAPHVPRKRRRRGRGEIERERNEEEFFAAQAVGEPAEIQRAGDGADQVAARGQPDIGRAEMQNRAFLERAGN